ncbi:sodium- and chloride-dependent glycine transporter 2-like [Amphiura filiformis]|uniref:sodium- and chloride-dependent glycine transporter 2-like n=1 Tax=Amphiura filiformis TaxID=82378 RepID=UPI003B2123D6
MERLQNSEGERPSKNGSVIIHDDKNGDENKERGNWSSPVEFILACLGYAVGLGNVWRFPYLCYRNGGGAFLIPYTIMLVFAGLPLFFLEVSFGQYCSEGMVTCWKALPLLRGMSIGQFLVSFYLNISYSVIIMYTIYYFFASFTSVLPWVGCNHNWNTAFCSSLVDDCFQVGGIMTANNTCANLTSFNQDQLDMYNVTYNYTSDEYDLSQYVDPFKDQRQPASQEYFKYQVLQQSDTMSDTGGVVWQLALCFIFAWIITFLCMIKGIKTTGKVVYFTATFPYFVLFILLIRGLTLPGSGEGIKYFITPRWEHLATPKVWLDAAVQIFYSLSVSAGGLTTLASYNKFHNNCYRDSLLVASLNCLTSLFAGFVIFAIVGFMAHEAGKEVDEVVTQGFGLAFVAYPEAVARMPAGPFWSVMFFLMLITLGLDSQFTGMEKMSTAVCDMFPRYLRKRRTLVMLVVCSVSCICGFTCVTRAGAYWMSLLDNYGANFQMLFYGLAEAAGLMWIYGAKRFTNDIRTMLGDTLVDSKLFYYWIVNWAVITPLLMAGIMIFNFINWSEPTHDNEQYPLWGRTIGWLIIASGLLALPIDWVYKIIKSPGSIVERINLLFVPSPKWGPALPQHRREAANVHKQHGTTMGGVLDLSSLNHDNEDIYKNAKYSALSKADTESAV